MINPRENTYEREGRVKRWVSGNIGWIVAILFVVLLAVITGFLLDGTTATAPPATVQSPMDRAYEFYDREFGDLNRAEFAAVALDICSAYDANGRDWDNVIEDVVRIGLNLGTADETLERYGQTVGLLAAAGVC